MLFGWPSNDGAVGWYRVRQPLSVLNEQGYQCAWSQRLPKELRPDLYGGKRALKQRVTLLAQMVAGGTNGEWFRALAREGQRVFYEIDDDIFHIDPSNPAHEEMTHPDYIAGVSANLAAATGVIVTRKALAAVVHEHTDAPVYIIPNYVPAWLCDFRHPKHPTKHEKPSDTLLQRRWRQEAVCVGWAGSGFHTMDWERFTPRLIQWVNRNPHAILDVMGQPQYLAAYANELPVGRVTGKGWIGEVEEFYRNIDFDIGLIPLKQHPFNESKSWIAALIYAALGIPVVASDVGPYHDFVLHGETGFLFTTPGEMAGYLDALTRDPELRATMGANARAVARAHTYEANAWKWAKVLLEEVHGDNEDLDSGALAH